MLYYALMFLVVGLVAGRWGCSGSPPSPARSPGFCSHRRGLDRRPHDQRPPRAAL